MSKYMILYNSDVKAKEMMSQASMDQMKTSMDEWMNWKAEAEKVYKVEFGLPLQSVSHVEDGNLSESDSRVNGYSIFEGEGLDELKEMLKSHPHLKRPGASIDVFELVLMPGMDAN